MTVHTDSNDLATLEALAALFPNTDRAVSEIAALKAQLDLSKPTVHVISDVHGDYKKLRHIINNASGSLRTLIEQLFVDQITVEEQRELLAVLYYPQEALEEIGQKLTGTMERRAWIKRTLRRQFEIVRALAGTYRRADVVKGFPPAHRELFDELLNESCLNRGASYVNRMIDTLGERGRDLQLVRAAAHVVRNLSIAELIVAGDLGDRGARLDRVIDYLSRQTKVRFVWGNHDVSWMGACLGHEALIATVLRLSLRYRRLSQLEEGYGITLAPLERLARTVYKDDPAEHFHTQGTGLRDDLVMARMQKAAAVMQFKLEGQVAQRHPEWNMEHRLLLHRINHLDGTVEVDGQCYALCDTHLPTLDPHNPYQLSKEEQECLARLRQSFVESGRLWEHMSFVVRQGAMWTTSDDTLIFHACVPTDEGGAFIPVSVEGEHCSGRELFGKLERIVRRGFARGALPPGSANIDADWLWFLWIHPLSPLFGKDRMATFETYFIADQSTHEELKNAYFEFIHDAAFCRRVLGEFGVSESEGLIVNGHVPVRVERGEQPVKRGGNAVTIDGAFSEAYGDRGYTLILAADRIALAEHHHFESIADAIHTGADIMPEITVLRSYHQLRRVTDGEQGARIRSKINLLERLVQAYEEGNLYERQDLS
ncbi:MAG: fructose-1,6-bisphosphatase [Acidobacteriota bacterium]|nr:fructose-1,6-bisphosphatase [Acidobacteriota bacterium]